jgi:beta-lactamase class A
MSKIKYLLVVLFFSLVINIILIGSFFAIKDHYSEQTNFEELQVKYPLISKRVLSEFPQDILINFLDLRRKLKKEVEPYGSSFGFYFEYLPTGTSIGVNEKNEFHAASLFKLPVVMAYYRMKERTKTKDDPMVTIKQDQLNNEFGNLWKKGEGYKLNLSEAVRLAIEESDNTAAQVVTSNITKEDFNAVYEGLDINLETDKEGAILTAKSYSSILKALYFSSVLNKDSSSEILALLTKTKFPDKLAAGIPDKVVVAHKIGDFKDKDGKNEAFTDCGIVYVPRRPYVLCMLSVGDEQTARERMQKTSKTIYDYISSL